MREPDDRWPRWLVPLFVGVLLVALVLTVVGTVLAEGKGSDVAVEAAKAGMQLGVITVFGAVLTQAFRRVNDERDARIKQTDLDREDRLKEADIEREDRAKEADIEREDRAKQADIERAERVKQADLEREDRRRLNDYRMTVFRDTVSAYNRVKAVRRTLRAVGINSSGEVPLSQWQVDELDAQMLKLNEAELALEQIEREVTAQRARFVHAWKEIHCLEQTEDYLRKVLNVWESRVLLTTDRDERQETSIVDFHTFVAKRRDTVPTTFWSSFDAFEEAIRADLIEPPWGQ